jgi:CheY-like chemotaxis protein
MLFRKNRILVVDDDPQFVRLQERMLRNQFILETASSGAEALSIARSFQPDLILLDINMPEMDSYETCRRLRQNERNRLVKIFVGNFSKTAGSRERIGAVEIVR